MNEKGKESYEGVDAEKEKLNGMGMEVDAEMEKIEVENGEDKANESEFHINSNRRLFETHVEEGGRIELHLSGDRDRTKHSSVSSKTSDIVSSSIRSYIGRRMATGDSASVTFSVTCNAEAFGTSDASTVYSSLINSFQASASNGQLVAALAAASPIFANVTGFTIASLSPPEISIQKSPPTPSPTRADPLAAGQPGYYAIIGRKQTSSNK